MNWKEFKPSIIFLCRFLGIYLAGNLLYGLLVTNYEPRPDPVTRLVTVQTSDIINLFGWHTQAVDYHVRPTVGIVLDNKAIISVYEGCNGVNVMIIFLAFVISFGPINKTFFLFAPIGLVAIHLSNLIRIGLLFLVSLKLPAYQYFSHKYLFTAFIYAVVFMLWVSWVKKQTLKKKHEQNN